MATVQTYFVKNPDGTLTNVTLNANGTICVPSGSTVAPAISPLNDTNTGVFFPAADNLALVEGGIEVLRIDSSGRVGIGTSTPSAPLHINGTANNTAITLSVNNTVTGYIGPTGFLNGGSDSNLGYRVESGNNHVFLTGATERARIDSSGRLLVGTSSARTNLYNGSGTSPLQIEGTTESTSAGLITLNSSTAAASPNLVFAKSAGTSLNSNTVVSADHSVGAVYFSGNDGSEFVTAARIEAFVDGTPGSNDMPGRLVFSTTADGASSPTERMRITQAGNILFGKTDNLLATTGISLFTSGATNGIGQFTSSADLQLVLNRKTDDGEMLRFCQDGTSEGNISVSGTTVSYNGAHLSRWSQIPGIDPHDKTDRPEILRGTVMSNLDEMCDWIDPESGDAQDNEQLNKTKVSDVEGDKNVAGVFQSWDDDDDTWVNDYYLAMTGDFVIRIAAGVTVERGDLLMSAGDGTAKPQDDDIIRSKTIAKVTSTTVSCTYEDGSYCVPCVLMAC